MKIKCLITFVVLVVALVYASPVYAQKPLKKPEKPTQTVPIEKSSSTTSKSNNKSSTTKSSTQSTTSNSAQTGNGASSQQSHTRNSDSQLQTNKPTNGYINGHEYVDLGLSVKWATCNVGASSPSDYGDYYAWGETKTKSEYTSNNSVTYEKNMGSIAGISTYDAARANWGGTWRLPTKAEIDELVSKCRHEWTKHGGHNGYKIIGPNGNSIFLPIAGWRYGTSLNDANEFSRYWSATPDVNNTGTACCLGFSNEYFYGGWNYRNYGQSVRPVTE